MHSHLCNKNVYIHSNICVCSICTIDSNLLYVNQQTIVYNNYRRDFILYTQVEQQPENFTNNGFDKKIVLSLTNDNHFDTVYTKQHITNLAFCQCK